MFRLPTGDIRVPQYYTDEAMHEKGPSELARQVKCALKYMVSALLVCLLVSFRSSVLSSVVCLVFLCVLCLLIYLHVLFSLLCPNPRTGCLRGVGPCHRSP
jgi:hypothetical protein